MEWKGGIFTETCLPFGLRSAPKLFNFVADLLAWIAEEQGVSSLLHYLDDFLTIGAPGTDECLLNLHTSRGSVLAAGHVLLDALEDHLQFWGKVTGEFIVEASSDVLVTNS